MFEKIDPYLEGWERALALPKGVTSRQWIPEFVSRILEIPVDLVAGTAFAQKIALGVGGLLLATIPQQIGPKVSREWSDRDTEDVNAIAKFWIAEMTDPTADDLVNIANAIQNLRMGISFGDWTRIASAFGVKSPAAMTADMQKIASAFGSIIGVPVSFGPAAPAPAPAAAPPLYRETLSSSPAPAAPAPAGQPAPTAIPGVPQVFRFTSDHAQPPAPPAVPRFRVTLG